MQTECNPSGRLEYSCPPEAPFYCATNGQCAVSRNSCPCPPESPIRCPDVGGRHQGNTCTNSFTQCPCPMGMRNCGNHCAANCTQPACQQRCMDSYACADAPNTCPCVPYLFLKARFPAEMDMSASDWNTIVAVTAQRYCDFSGSPLGESKILLNVSMTWILYSLGPNGDQQYVDLKARSEDPTSYTLQLLPYALEANRTYRVVGVARGTPMNDSLPVDTPTPTSRELASSISGIITTYLRSPRLYFKGEQTRVVTKTSPDSQDLVSLQLTIDTPCYGSTASCLGGEPMERLKWKSDEWDLVQWSCTFGHSNISQSPCPADILQQILKKTYYYNGAALRVVTQSAFDSGYTYAISAMYRGVVATQQLIVSCYNGGDSMGSPAPGVQTLLTATINCQVVDLGGNANGQRVVFSRDVVACTVVFEVDTSTSGSQVITPEQTPTTIWELNCEDPTKNGEAYTGPSLLLVPEGRGGGWRNFLGLPMSRCLHVSVKATTSIAYGGSSYVAVDTYAFNRTSISTTCTLSANGVTDTDDDLAICGGTSISASCDSSSSWPQLDWMVYHQQLSNNGSPTQSALLPYPSSIPLVTFMAPPPSNKTGTPYASIIITASYSGRPVYVSAPIRLNLTILSSTASRSYIDSQMDSMRLSFPRWNVTSSGVFEWVNSVNLIFAIFSSNPQPPTPNDWAIYIRPTLQQALFLSVEMLGGNVSYGEDASMSAQRLSSELVLISQQAHSMLTAANTNADNDLVASIMVAAVNPQVVDPNDADSYLTSGLSVAMCTRNISLQSSSSSSIIFAVARGLATSSAPGAGWELSYSSNQAVCPGLPTTKGLGNITVAVKGFAALVAGTNPTTFQPFPIVLNPNVPAAWGYQQQLLSSQGNAAVAIPDGLLGLSKTSTSTTDTPSPAPLTMSVAMVLAPPLGNMVVPPPSTLYGGYQGAEDPSLISIVMHVEVSTDQGPLVVKNLPSSAPIWICVPVSPAVVAAACTSNGKGSTCSNYRLRYFDTTTSTWASDGVIVPVDHIVVSTPGGITVCGYTTHLTAFAVVAGNGDTKDPKGKDDDGEDRELMSSKASFTILATVCVATVALVLLAAFQYYRRRQEYGRKGLVLEEGGDQMMGDMSSGSVVVLPSKNRYPPSPRSPRTRSASYPGPGYVPPTIYNPPTKQSSDSMSSFNTSPQVTPNRGGVATPITPTTPGPLSRIGTAHTFVVTLKNDEDKRDVAHTLQQRASREQEQQDAGA